MIRWVDGLGDLLGMEVSPRFAESWEEIGSYQVIKRDRGQSSWWNLVRDDQLRWGFRLSA